MRELLVLTPGHWRGGSTHWPATSWVRMHWAGTQAQGHGVPPVVLYLSSLEPHSHVVCSQRPLGSAKYTVLMMYLSIIFCLSSALPTMHSGMHHSAAV